MFAILPLGSFLIARVGDRSREGQRVCINKARREFAAWSPWGDRWVPEITWVSNRRLQNSLGLDIVPVDGRQAGLNRQRRDLIVMFSKNDQNKLPHFLPGPEWRQGRGPWCPTCCSQCETVRRRRREEADRIVLVHCSALLASHKIWGKRLMGALWTQTLLRISRSIQKSVTKWSIKKV